MTFFYYEIQTRRFIQSTNIRALEEFSGISYNKIRGWFINGNVLYVDESVICGCSDLVRGKQRIQKVGRIERREVVSNDNTGPIEHIKQSEEVKVRRETRQPEKRDGSGFDDFFKEVK